MTIKELVQKLSKKSPTLGWTFDIYNKVTLLLFTLNYLR